MFCADFLTLDFRDGHWYNAPAPASLDMNDINPRHILITGAAGFIGSSVLRHLWSRYPDAHFTVLDALTYAGDLRNIDTELQQSGRFSFQHGDILDEGLVERLVGAADYVLHFAAETHVSRSIHSDRQFFYTDVIGTQVIMHAVLKHRASIKRVVHISTSEVYGTARHPKMSESHPLEPQSPYAAAKVGADRLVYSYYQTYQIPVVIVRPFNAYGTNQHPEKLIPRFITNALLGEPLTIHGDGASERDFTHTRDIARALDLLLRAPAEVVEGEVFNIGNDASISVRDIVVELERAFARTGVRFGEVVSTVHVGDRPGQIARHTADSEKIRTTLGWAPEVSFADGLAEVVEWYAKNQSWWESKLEMRTVPIMMATGETENL